MFLVEAWIASAVICVYHLWRVCVFPWGVFLSSRVTGVYPVTTDLIMRVNVRTATTTTLTGSICIFKCTKAVIMLRAATTAVNNHQIVGVAPRFVFFIAV